MFNFKPFLEGNWKCVHPQDLPWNQSQYPCTFQIYWNYHFCLCAHCQNSPILHWTSEEHLWPCKYWNHANHFRFKLDILWNLISIYLVTSSALLLKMYLPTFSESNVWDFCLVVTGISEIIPQFFKDFRMLPKMSKDVLTTSSTSEAFERDSFSLLWNSYNTKSILSAFLEYFCGNCFNWISLLIMYWRTITNSSRFVGQAWEIVLWWCVGTMS